MKSSSIRAVMSGKSALALMPIALLLAACGGGGGVSDIGSLSSSTAPILQVGMHRQYIGNTTRTVVYTSPSGANPNTTLAYSFTQVQDVLPASAGAPGTFDIHTVTNYTILQDPGTGTVPVSQTTDDFRNLVNVGSSQASMDLAQTSTSTSIDESANALGGGPYIQTTRTSANYTTARQSLTYPLITGTSISIPQSSEQTITFSDVNSAGSPPLNGSNAAYTRVRSEHDDGSFSFQQTSTGGASELLTQYSDGSGSNTVTNASGTTTTTLSVPLYANGGYSIPVIRINTSTGSNKSYAAADWYPHAGLPSAPLVSQIQTVVGPVAALPAECSGALVQPNMVEVDSSTSNLNTINASLSQTSTRSFNANGVAVCTLTLQTSQNYNLLTGALVSTTTTQTNTLLKSL